MRFPGVSMSIAAAAMLWFSAAPLRAAGPDDLTIDVQGDCPGPLTVSWEGATIGRWAVLIFSRRTGRMLLPAGPCQGTWIDLDLRQARFAGAWRIESEQGQLVGRSGASACGGYLQLVINAGAPCATSNVVQIPE